MLRIKNLSKSFGTNVLFSDADLLLTTGDVVALIGQNGTGKTTLMKCIVGEEDFEGIIEVSGTVSIMEQEKEFEKSSLSFTRYLDAKLDHIEVRKKHFEELLGEASIYESEKYEHVLREYELLTAGITEKVEESRIRKILKNLQFEMEDYQKSISNLSGGQKTKLRLAECLSKKSDFLILDEPTNHLDFSTIHWLEEYLKKLGKTILIVSHDRYFLSQLVNKVVEIENTDLILYKEDYTGYVSARVLHLHALTKQYHSVTKEKKRLLASAAEKRKWASKNADRGMKLLADKLERRANELPDVINPEDLVKEFRLNFESVLRPSDVVFSLKNVGKAFDSLVFEGVSFDIRRGEKIAVIGDNGTGKSTLLRILNGMECSGEVSIGNNVKLGYFDQEFKNMDLNQRVRDFLLHSLTHMHDSDIMSMAIKFGFPKEKFRNKLKTLSGGEKARINLVRLLNEKCNVLLLDEPTNNLDFELIQALEKALLEYKGTVVFVSHDRYFISKVALKTIVVGDEVKMYDGSMLE